jgi:hypothetical protein
MEQNARLRINLIAREIEVEGSEAFVREYSEKFENLLSSLAEFPALPPATEGGKTTIIEAPMATGLPANFGEYLHMFPRDITDLDKMLIAGYYAQFQSSDNSFTTAIAHSLLKEQGIKPTNAADCVTKNKKTKKVFALEKSKFRVSSTGSEYLDILLTKVRGSS